MTARAVWSRRPRPPRPASTPRSPARCSSTSRNKAYTDNKAVKEYTDFYIDNLETIAKASKFIPLNEEDYSKTKSTLESIS